MAFLPVGLVVGLASVAVGQAWEGADRALVACLQVVALQGVLEAFAVAVGVGVEGAHLAWDWADGTANSTGEACEAILVIAVAVVVVVEVEVEVVPLAAANWQVVAEGASIRDDCSSEAEWVPAEEEWGFDSLSFRSFGQQKEEGP